MKIKNIKDPWIAKEKFNNISKIQNKLSHEKWVEFINSNQKYFTWYENTESGKNIKNRIDEVPPNFKEGVLRSLKNKKACAEFNNKKKYYEVIIQYNDKLGVIGTTFMKPIKKEQLKILLEMANYLDAYLLNNGTQIIDEIFLEKLT